MSGEPFLKTGTSYITVERSIQVGSVHLQRPAGGVTVAKGRLVWELSGVKVKHPSGDVWVPYSNVSLVVEDKES